MEHEKKDIQKDEFYTDEVPDISRNPKTVKHTKQPHPFRWFLFLILLSAAILYGLQWYLDLEAQAMVYAQQTASAGEEDAASSASPVSQEKVLTATETPSPPPATATSDPLMLHTQTVAAQLTEVAEFQQTVTPGQ